MGSEFSEVLAATDITSLSESQQADDGAENMAATTSSQAEITQNVPASEESDGLSLLKEQGTVNGIFESGKTDVSRTAVLRRYSEEEDNLILEMWYDKRLRPELSQRLQRPLGGLAYRFYQILKERGMDPSQYRREMKSQKAGHRGRPSKFSPKVERPKIEGPSFWNARLDINLWKWRRSGEDWEAIAAKIPGATPTSCQERYELLVSRNQGQGLAEERMVISGVQEDIAGSGATAKGLEAPQRLSARSDQDILTALKYFPDRAAELENRMQQLETELKTLREQNGIRLSDLIASLMRVDDLLNQRDRLAGEMEGLRRENERLKAQLTEELRKIETERQELQQVYHDLDTMLSDFMRLSSVDKLRVLGDFAGRLEITVDKFGNVVRTRRRI
ncbi:MAG: hypothetical protein ACM3TT_06270 [Syntrophothermus sp.]